MAVYGLPQEQALRLQAIGSQPWGGVANRVPGLAQFLQGREQRRLQVNNVGLLQQMNEARINQMLFNQQMAEKQFGLSKTMTNWKYNQSKDAIKDAEKNLNWQTWLGLGTAGFAAYEGKHRAEETAKEAAIINEIREEQLKAIRAKKKTDQQSRFAEYFKMVK